MPRLLWGISITVLFAVTACVVGDGEDEALEASLTTGPLFEARFEGTTQLSAPLVQRADSWQYFTGTDTRSTWPMTIWGTTAAATGMHLIHYDLGGKTVDQVQKNAIVSMIGHDGTTTRALEMRILDPNALQGCCAQDTFQLSGLTAPPRELYQRFWLKLPAEAEQQCKNGPGAWWRGLWTYKTKDDHRISVQIFPYGQNGCGSWYVVADTNTGSGKYADTDFWTRTNNTVPVRFGQWMLVEVYVRRTKDASARFFLGIDGQTVFDVRDGSVNAFFGPDNQELNLILMSLIYGEKAYAYPTAQWVDDVELHSVPPCGAAKLPCGAATPVSTNLARGRQPTSSTTLITPSYATDGDRGTTRMTGGGSGSQWIQLDLGQRRTVSSVTLWHYYTDGRTYRDVIVQLSNVADFSSGVRTVFNNDRDNTSGQGPGTSAEYAESASGKSIAVNGIEARYVRLWSNGSNINVWNHYAEVEVLGF